MLVCKKGGNLNRLETKYDIDRKNFNIGEHSYLGNNFTISNPSETRIGKYCSISHNVSIGPSQHPTNLLTTHLFTYNVSRPELYGELFTPEENIIDIINMLNLPVKIGNDVWIGANSVIMDGLTIGDGAVIGSGAIVTKDVPPYAIVVGVPAKILRYRFEKHLIDELLELKWWDYPEDFIVTLPFADIEGCIKLLKENKNLQKII